MLYAKNIANVVANSLKLSNCSGLLTANIKMIIVVVIKLVNKSHNIDTAQNIGKFAPLAYCRNRALFSFSYSI